MDYDVFIFQMFALQSFVDNHIKELKIEDKDIENFDIDWKHLSDIEFLILERSTIKSFKGIEKLTKLQKLGITSIDSKLDISGISGLNSIWTLSVFMIAPNCIISNLPNLEYVDIRLISQDGDDKLIFDNLPKLKKLTIASWYGTLSMDKITSDSIEYMNINCKFEFPAMPKLKELDVETNGKLKKLENINLYKVENKICDEYRILNYKIRIYNSLPITERISTKMMILDRWSEFLCLRLNSDGYNRLSFLSQ